MFETTPVIKLGDHFKKVRCLSQDERAPTDIIDCRYNNSRNGSRKSLKSLSSTILLSQVTSISAVTLRYEALSLVWVQCFYCAPIGLRLFTVVANEGQRIDIPDGCILENRLLSGNLNMIVRVRPINLMSDIRLIFSRTSGAISRPSLRFIFDTLNWLLPRSVYGCKNSKPPDIII